MAAPWKLPLNLALLFHVLILTGAIILPRYLPNKPILPKTLTVNLVSMAPAAPSQKATPPQTAPPKSVVTIKIPKLKQAQSRKTAPIATAATTTPVVQPVPTKAISIKPLKRKIKKKIPSASSAAIARQRKEARLNKIRLEEQHQQLLQEARRQEKLAAAEEDAANEAVQALKQMLRTDAEVASSAAAARPATPSNGTSDNIITTQYNAAISGILMENWALPDIKPWNPDLMAIVIIDIAKSGRIIRHSFEKRSGDRVFDQFVSRTIQESNPLLPIPTAMHSNQYSIGLRFRPGQIQ